MKDLPYSINGLDPYINDGIMEHGYARYNPNYVNKLNKNLQLIDKTLTSDDDHKIHLLAQEIKYNFGCYINHELFWENLAPVSEGGGVAPKSSSSLG